MPKPLDEQGFDWTPPADETRESGAPQEALLRLACLDYAGWNPAHGARARRLLGERPELARASLYAAAAVGDVAAARAFLEREPALVNHRGGPLAWEPLLYACYSRLDSPAPEHSTLAVARLLLARGADPNAGFLWHGNVPPFTALTGVFGEGEDGNNQPPHRERDALVRLLLEAGADPNDGQTLYNRHFNRDDGHLRLLFEFGLGQDRGGPWFARLGERLFSPGKMLVEELWAAAKKDFAERVRLLVEHGVDVDGRSFRDGRSAHEAALLAGNREIAEYLRAHGATAAELAPEQAFAAACTAGDRARALALRAREPALPERLGVHGRAQLLSAAVGAGRAAGVRLMAELGFELDAMDCQRTALHEAAWSGNVAMIELLLELGADPGLREPNYRATPLGWAEHNRQPAAVRALLPFADVFAALRCDGVERVRELLAEEPARAHALDEDGAPPLFSVHAELRHAPELLALLFANGADPDARDRAGATALDRALAGGHGALAELLRGHGARTSRGA